MVEVQIRGKSYPLCLTVAALDEVTARCGGLGNIGSFLDGKDPQYIIPPEGAEATPSGMNMVKMVSNTTWLLGVLLREGENNRLMLARLAGEPAERRAVPDGQELPRLLTVASALKYRSAVMAAVAESMTKEIEAVYPKKRKRRGAGVKFCSAWLLYWGRRLGMGRGEVMATRIGEILDMIDCHAIANGAEPKESAAPMSLADALLL